MTDISELIERLKHVDHCRILGDESIEYSTDVAREAAEALEAARLIIGGAAVWGGSSHYAGQNLRSLFYNSESFGGACLFANTTAEFAVSDGKFSSPDEMLDLVDELIAKVRENSHD